MVNGSKKIQEEEALDPRKKNGRWIHEEERLDPRKKNGKWIQEDPRRRSTGSKKNEASDPRRRSGTAIWKMVNGSKKIQEEEALDPRRRMVNGSKKIQEEKEAPDPRRKSG
ncbi:hypothetical protein AMTR_s00199p00017110 [Amborella trichopoda]|uniref:Uncharacterized protein n=1 Tax=Amborella trichopoda TaxID=13333 RepID=U5CZD8_AMBTC|nr:hypothetical protein AMTR_s00199p00017110 [Amborella trichopoda]